MTWPALAEIAGCTACAELAAARQRVVVGDPVSGYHPSAAVRFGPGGAPMAALREDLAYAAKVAGCARGRAGG